MRSLLFTFIALAALLGCTNPVAYKEAPEDEPADAGMPGNAYVDQPVDNLSGNEAPVGGWSASGMLVTGQGSGLGTEQVANPKGKLVTLQVQFPEPGTYSIQFGLQPQGLLLPGQVGVYIAEAYISWSIAGNTITRRVSVQNNITISGVGQAVRIVMWDTTPTSPSLAYSYTANLNYLVTATVTKGLRPTTRIQPILFPGFTVPIFGGASGRGVDLSPGFYVISSNQGFCLIPIPQDAGINAVLVVVNDPSGLVTPGTISMSKIQAQLINQASGGSRGEWSPFTQPGIWMPILPGTDLLGLANFLAASNQGVQFSVFYAIDG